MHRKESEIKNTPPDSAALAQKLEQGLSYYKIRKFGNAIACFRELVKNLKHLDPSKQQILAKALQSTTTGCLKKGKYRKAIKSAKLTIRTLIQLARTHPEAEIELLPARQKLLTALQGYLKYTLEQHKRLLWHELQHGNAPKGKLLQLCREGLKLLIKPLVPTDPQNKLKNTPANQIFHETLKSLLEWLLKEEIRCHENHQYLDALVYCKFANGPLREVLAQSCDDLSAEKEILELLAKTQNELESILNAAANQELEAGLVFSLKADNPQTENPAEAMESAKRNLIAAAEKYHYLDNHEKWQETQLLLKKILGMQHPLRQTGFHSPKSIHNAKDESTAKYPNSKLEREQPKKHLLK